MNFEIPILVEQQRNKGQTSFHVQPLFLEHFRVRRDRLSSALSKLLSDLRKYAEQIRGNESETEFLARLSFNPDVTVSRQKLELVLKREVVKLTACVAAFPHLGRRQAFLPADRNLWIDYEKKELQSRLSELLTDEFRKLERQSDSVEALKQRQMELMASGSPWLTHLRMDISTRRRRAKSDTEERLSFFGTSQKFVGATELHAVGDCLDHLYPDELNRAVLRDTEAGLLRSLMQSSDKRPVLILGASRVGKTTLVHEYVFDAVRNRSERQQSKRNVWHVAPQRIVTGMSYVGQWEDRVLSILQFMKKRQHVLYLDDMLGMYQAGTHSKSSLSAADVLKPFVDRRDLQLLVEMTPGQFRVFRERDRGFADMFQIVRLEATSEEDTVRILVHRAQKLEQTFQAKFDLDVIPTVLELTRRYDRESAFPGKAAKQLQELAVKHSRKTIGRKTVLDEFRVRTGFREGFVDSNVAFDRREIQEMLSRDVLGQPEAVESICDVISVARARLNDPHRPLGAFLFPGPTGVGKTHCAKSLAKYLYGDVSRLLRFDMNEYQTSWSVARLVGTFDQPDGLLTSAVRRQPFCVILCDEIEKAHPDINDLLLQVLGEARLSDSFGRTVDFSGAVIILTSNLGARDAVGRVGLGSATQASIGATYLKAVREFFRPEFVNRFDRIIPFRPLQKDDIRGIAESLLHDLLSREGFLRRKCCIEINAGAVECVVERGYQPEMGARAMRRALEQQIVRPVSARLAEINPETPSIVRLAVDKEQILADVFELKEADPLPHAMQTVPNFKPSEFVDRMQSFLNRIQSAIDRRQPTGPLALTDIPDDQYWYLGASALLRELEDDFLGYQDAQSESRAATGSARVAPGPAEKILIRNFDGVKPRRILKDLVAATDIHAYLQELTTSPSASESSTAIASLIDSAKRLDLLMPTDGGWKEDRVLIVARVLTRSALPSANSQIVQITGKHIHSTMAGDEVCFGRQFYVQKPLSSESRASRAVREIGMLSDQGGFCAPWTDLLSTGAGDEDAELFFCVAFVTGFRAAELLAMEEGTFLRFEETGRMIPIQVVVRPVAPGQSDAAAFQQLLADQASFDWKNVLTIKQMTKDPFDSDSAPYDLRTLQAHGSSHLLSLLPSPPEFAGGEA